MIDQSMKKSVSTRSFVEKKVHPLLESGLSPINGSEASRKLSCWDTTRKNSSLVKLTQSKTPADVSRSDAETEVFRWKEGLRRT